MLYLKTQKLENIKAKIYLQFCIRGNFHLNDKLHISQQKKRNRI